MKASSLGGPKPQFIDANGNPYSGAKLFFYAAGSSTKQNTYRDSTGVTPNANPIVLDSSGRPTYEIWFTDGLTYKAVLAPSTDSDPPNSPIFTVDNLAGINDVTASVDEWQASGLTPTYVGATSFTVSGDQTATFTAGRRLKSTNTAGTIYSTVASSSYNGGTLLTTVTVVNDSGTLDSGLSAVSLSILRSSASSLPWTKVSSSGLVSQFAAGAVSAPSITTVGDTNTGVYYPGADTIALVTGGVEALQANSSQNIGIGTAPVASTRCAVVATGANAGLLAKSDNNSWPAFQSWVATTSGDGQFAVFYTEAAATSRGSIAYNRGAGQVAYNVTSDYRAKDIEGPVTGALSTVSSLKPYIGRMKGATISRPMFIAHEVQQVIPYAVTGEKDAVDDHGKPQMQNMDHQILVPLLTAAIQELKAEFDAYKAAHP